MQGLNLNDFCLTKGKAPTIIFKDDDTEVCRTHGEGKYISVKGLC